LVAIDAYVATQLEAAAAAVAYPTTTATAEVDICSVTIPGSTGAAVAAETQPSI
jgi:hypothetical protein